MVQEVEERRRRTLIGVTVEIDGESIKVGGF
jgi:ribosome-associated protein YbcJ (S4-like RNA binding protein)